MQLAVCQGCCNNPHLETQYTGKQEGVIVEYLTTQTIIIIIILLKFFTF